MDWDGRVLEQARQFDQWSFVWETRSANARQCGRNVISSKGTNWRRRIIWLCYNVTSPPFQWIYQMYQNRENRSSETMWTEHRAYITESTMARTKKLKIFDLIYDLCTIWYIYNNLSEWMNGGKPNECTLSSGTGRAYSLSKIDI